MIVIKQRYQHIYIWNVVFFSLDVKQPSILDALSKPKPASKAPAAKKIPSFDSSDSESEKKAPVTKQKPVLKRKKNLSDDSDSSSSDNLMSRLKSKTTAGTKVSFYTELSCFLFMCYVIRCDSSILDVGIFLQYSSQNGKPNLRK